MKKNIRKRKIILLLGDTTIYYFSLIITLIVAFRNRLDLKLFWDHIIPFSILLLFWIIICAIFDLYQLEKFKKTLFLLNNIFFATISFSLITAIFFYIFSNFGITPKTNLLIFGLVLLILTFLWRQTFKNIFKNYLKKNVLIVGKSEAINLLIQAIKENPHLGYQIVRQIPKWDENIIEKLINDFQVNTIILQQPSPIPHQIDLSFILSKGVNIWDLSEAYEAIFQKIPIQHINHQWFLNNFKEGEKILEDKIRRIIDIFLSFFFLAISLPLILTISILIKLEDWGPIFYKQKRIGRNLKEFYIYKFRSMIPEAEKSIVMWAQKNDPRITKIGKILRKTHFDEIPQMVNILKGDISFVGPRPERPEFVKKLQEKIPFYNLRHIIKPGFTGWAQIKFRYARSIEDSFQKLEYDLYYIKNRSILLDLYIIIKTVSLLFKE